MERIDVLNGNQAAAIGATLAKPDIIAAYPITPQTPVVEYLTQYAADGVLNSTMSEVESELTAMSVVTGASLAGSRTFTATSSQGLSLMYEPYFRASTLRLPIVMAIVNREMISPQTVWGGPQDSISVRDAGWLQIYVEDNQEILDMMLQAYRIAEHPEVLLPINICYDGFYLSHMAEKVSIPDEKKSSDFVGKYASEHILLDPEKPMAVDPLTNGNLLMNYRFLHLQAQQKALSVIDQVDQAFQDEFGRSYGGQIECYRMDDAEHAIITLGSMTGVARDVVDQYRDSGKRVGLIKVRVLRPFPKDRMIQAVASLKSFGVIDRNVSFGWNTGVIYQEIKSALYESKNFIPCMPFIAGLGGEDITFDMVNEAIELVLDTKEIKTTHWLERK